MNDGKGNFTDSGQRLPDGTHKISTGVVTSADIDRDGDLDLFVGERVKIGQYGALCSGFILVNDGKGNFTNETSTRGAVFKDFGMFTDAVFADLDGDNLPELIATGEFMPLSIFKNKNGKFELLKQLENSSGWWNTLRLTDLDNDGDMDIIGGNHGLNSRFKASPDRPVMLYFNDFDANGDPEAVLCNVHENGKKYPYALRHTLTTRMPALKKKFPDFQSFREADMLDIFGEEKLKASTVWSAVAMASCIFINDGNYNFTKQALPVEAQFSPVYCIELTDVNKDGNVDIILGGNLYGAQPETGRYDASYGNILINNGKAGFTDATHQYGLSVKGEIRSVIAIGTNVFFFINNGPVRVLQLQ
ncbi:MAG: VCBS repeat-containing protein [Saprospiraceae bacterium]|nr:VCBS repeat-containing protein [Saprospiraceae bacterium]